MQVLFHHDVVVAVLGSGSRGNCTYVGDGRQGVLIDCGLSTRQVFKRMEAVGLGGAPLDAVLVTHEHSDHVGAAGVLSRRLRKDSGQNVPFYMSRGTRWGLHPSCVPERLERAVAGRAFKVGRWTVEPYTVPHDTVDPLAYVVDMGPVRVGVLTDLGCATRLVARKLASMDIAVLEFNHDVEMLIEGSYPWSVKQRIRSRHGHLSNEQSEDLLARSASDGRLRHVILAHLSGENNSAEHAYTAADRGAHRAGKRLEIRVAEQDDPIEPVRDRMPVPARPSRPVRLSLPRIPRTAPLLAADAQQALFEF